MIHFPLILSGAMASSAVSSVLHLRDAAGNHADTRAGAYIYLLRRRSRFPREWEFRTRLRIAGKTCDQYIEAMSKVFDGLRGDAFVAAQEVGFDNLCDIVDGIPRGIDTLIPHLRGTVFSLTEHESKELVPPVLPSWRTLVQTKREEHEAVCLAATTLLDTLGSDGPSNSSSAKDTRSDMSLDLSGLTREERVMVQASINVMNVILTELPKLSSSKIRENISGRTKDERRAKAKTDSNVLTIRILVGSAGRAKASIGNGKSGASAHHANLTSVEDHNYYHDEDLDESANANEAHNDPVDPGSDDGEEAPDYDDDEEHDTLSSYIAVDDVTIYEAAELDAIALLADTWNDDLDPEVQVNIWYKRVFKSLPFFRNGQRKRKRKM